MAAGAAVTVAQLAAKLALRGTQVVGAVEQATDQFADFLTARAAANAPRQTGELAGSIRKVAETVQNGVIRRHVVAEAPHALAVHERAPHLDGAHQAETTPEGYPGREYLTRPLRFHREAFGTAVQSAAQAGLRKPVA